MPVHVKLTDHCNLNCVGCNVFSPLAGASYLDTSTYARDLKRLHSVLGDNIDLFLFGGEPLLHPDLVELLHTSRRILGKAEISVVSNGTLVARQGEDFWHALKEDDITLRTTKYPIDVDYDEIERRCGEDGIRFAFHDGEEPKTTRYVQGVDPKGAHNAGGSFHRCIQRYCTTLEKGKLYPCPVIPSAVHFSKHFGCEMLVSPKDYLDIYETRSARHMLNHTIDRKSSVPFCRYCDIDTRSSSCVDFKRSTKNISEWVSVSGSTDEPTQG